MDRDEIHTILDAVLDYIERGGHIEIGITDKMLDIVLDDAGICYEYLHNVNAATTKSVIDRLETKGVKA